MKASVDGRTVAESGDTVEVGGYIYFPKASVKLDWLEKAPKTESDLECPHGVQFYDVVVAGRRHERAAWPTSARCRRWARSRTASPSGRTSRSGERGILRPCLQRPLSGLL
jgi:hypothetical protein